MCCCLLCTHISLSPSGHLSCRFVSFQNPVKATVGPSCLVWAHQVTVYSQPLSLSLSECSEADFAQRAEVIISSMGLGRTWTPFLGSHELAAPCLGCSWSDPTLYPLLHLPAHLGPIQKLIPVFIK